MSKELSPAEKMDQAIQRVNRLNEMFKDSVGYSMAMTDRDLNQFRDALLAAQEIIQKLETRIKEVEEERDDYRGTMFESQEHCD